nr:hypothetical protein [Tanacetum cinerariifolium]
MRDENPIRTLGDYSKPSHKGYKNTIKLLVGNNVVSLRSDTIRMEIKTQQPEEPKPTLEDEFQDLHLNLPVLEVLAYAPIHNVILDKYVESLELGKNGSTFVQGEDPETPLLVGKGFLATANVVIDCRIAKIVIGEGITRSVFEVKGVDLGEEAPYWTTLAKRESYKPRPHSDGVGAQTLYYARKDSLDCYLLGEWEIARDVELNPFKDTLVFRRIVELLEAIPINLKSNIFETIGIHGSIHLMKNWGRNSGWHKPTRVVPPIEAAL